MRQQRNRSHRPQRRTGVVTLEVILCLPLLIIPTMAIIEFGMLYSYQQTLEMASRAGANEASCVALPETGSIPQSVLDAINKVLADKNITLGHVRLEHNVEDADPMNNPMGTPPFVLTSGALNCPTPTVPAAPATRQYVRVTVCVESTELAPNLLKTFGFDLSNRVSQQSTTRRYKL